MNVRGLKMIERRNDKQGFSLLEVLIALLILSIGVLGLLAVQYQSFGARVYTKRMKQAISANSAVSEEMMVRDYTLLNGSGSQYRFRESALQVQAEEGAGVPADGNDFDRGDAFDFKWSINPWFNLLPNPNAEIAQMKTVSLDAEWKTKGISHKARIVTLERNGRYADTVSED